jgi:saccharopine dehydrogenase-like NADP-dependent oxidoreductase
MHDDILIVGGYGQVGRAVADRLGHRFPSRVVVAGRSLERAEAFARLTDGRVRPLQLDVTDPAAASAALDTVSVVVMCVDQPSAGFARTCLGQGVHYVDVTATYRIIEQIEALGGVAHAHGATAVLSVGLSPGVTNLLAWHTAAPFDEVERIDLSILLGLGDVHGTEALCWMIEASTRPFTLQTADGPAPVEALSGPRTVEFPPPFGQRVAYRIDLSDQHVVRRTLGAGVAESRVCFEPAWATELVAAAKRIGLLRWAGRLSPRALAVLSRLLRWGSDTFVVQAEVRGLIDGEKDVRMCALSGQREAEATGLVAAFVAERLYGAVVCGPGVFHIGEVLVPREVFAVLEAEGFRLHQHAPIRPQRRAVLSTPAPSR